MFNNSEYVFDETCPLWRILHGCQLLPMFPMSLVPCVSVCRLATFRYLDRTQGDWQNQALVDLKVPPRWHTWNMFNFAWWQICTAWTRRNECRYIGNMDIRAAEGERERETLPDTPSTDPPAALTGKNRAHSLHHTSTWWFSGLQATWLMSNWSLFAFVAGPFRRTNHWQELDWRWTKEPFTPSDPRFIEKWQRSNTMSTCFIPIMFQQRCGLFSSPVKHWADWKQPADVAVFHCTLCLLMPWKNESHISVAAWVKPLDRYTVLLLCYGGKIV